MRECAILQDLIHICLYTWVFIFVNCCECARRRDIMLPPTIFRWKFPTNRTWAGGHPHGPLHTFPGANLFIWISCIFIFLIYRPLFAILAGKIVNNCLTVWVRFCIVIIAFSAGILAICSLFIPWMHFIRGIVQIVGSSGHGEGEMTVLFWLQFMGSCFCILSAVGIAWLLPSFLKCLVFYNLYVPFWSGPKPIPTKFVEHIISVYENTRLRNDLLENVFGNDISSVIRQYLPEWHVYDEFAKPHEI